MFKAIVFACMIQSPEECLQLDDTLGLKPTKVQCGTRITEMINSIKFVIPDYEIVGAKCENMGTMT